MTRRLVAAGAAWAGFVGIAAAVMCWFDGMIHAGWALFLTGLFLVVAAACVEDQ